MLRAVHAEYLQRAVDQCFLNKKAQYIIQAILNILDVAADLENPELLDKAAIDAVRARAGRLSGLGIFLYKSVLYGAFVWVRMALNSQKRRFSDRAEGGTRNPGKESGACYSDEGKVTPDQRQRQGYRRGHRYRRGRCLRRRPGAEG